MIEINVMVKVITVFGGYKSFAIKTGKNGRN